MQQLQQRSIGRAASLLQLLHASSQLLPRSISVAAVAKHATAATEMLRGR
jgi:hypothetical protein